jgi:hypothetical protein
VPVHIARLGPRGLSCGGTACTSCCGGVAARPKAAAKDIGARCATAEEAETLGFERGAPVLTMTRNACTRGTCGSSNDVAAGVIGRDKVPPLS